MTPTSCEAATVAQCSFCGGLFAFVVGVVHTPAELGGGRKAQNAHVDELYELQQRLCAVNATGILPTEEEEEKDTSTMSCPPLLPCPACNAYVHGLGFHGHQAFLAQPDAFATLFPSRFVTFEDNQPAPIYCLTKSSAKQSGERWELRNGVGPPNLELDNRAKSNLIYHNSVRKVLPPHVLRVRVLSTAPQPSDDDVADAAEAKRRATVVEAAWRSAVLLESQATISRLAQDIWEACPLLVNRNWERIEAHLESYGDGVTDDTWGRP